MGAPKHLEAEIIVTGHYNHPPGCIDELVAHRELSQKSEFSQNIEPSELNKLKYCRYVIDSVGE